MDSYICSPGVYIAFVMACFLLAVIFLVILALLCIHFCERLEESQSSSVDVEALLEDCSESQDLVGPLSAMRVLSGASLLTTLAPKSLRRTDVDFDAW